MKRRRKESMKQTMKQRLVAIICMVCMLLSVSYVGTPIYAEAEGTDITLENAPEREFKNWTFSDVGLTDQTVTDNLNWGTDWQEKTAAKTLDKTLFTGKIKFADDSTQFGNLYIGGAVRGDNSKYRGFIIRGYNGTDPNLTFGFAGKDGIFYNKDGATNEQIAVFYSEQAGVALRGNSELELAISVEYTDVTIDGLVTMQVGVFFNGKLYNNEYFTVKDVPEEYLTQNIRWYAPSGTNAIASYSLKDTSLTNLAKEEVILENAPEKEFSEWTFQDVGIADKTLTDNDLWNTEYTNGRSLDKTIFRGKIKFSNDSFGNFYIGAKDPTSGSKWRGLLFTANGADKLNFGFVGTDGCFFDANGKTTNTSNGFLTVFDPAVAGTTLRGNADLQVSISVEYVNQTSDKTDLKLGVFFDGKLYDNTYYTVKDVPLGYLKQTIRFYPTCKSNEVKSCVAGTYLENMFDMGYEEWTFSDVGIADQTLSGHANMATVATTTPKLDKTIFNGKILFPAGSGNNFGHFYVGGASDANSTNGTWTGFYLRGSTTVDEGLDLLYTNDSGTAYNICTFKKETAGTTLRGNENLQVSVSVETIKDTESGSTVTVKLGVFFDGKLYDNQYYYPTVSTGILYKTAKWANAQNSPRVASHRASQITLENAPEKDYTYWTFSDIGIQDQVIVNNYLWDNLYTNNGTLNETIFNGKINFDNTTNFGNCFIGGVNTTDGSKYSGFLFNADGTTDCLNFGFYGAGYYYNENGNTGSGSKTGILTVITPEKAGTTLRGNSELQVSISVKYVSVTDTTATLKVGLFLDGKLYNNEYYTVKDVPKEYLYRTVHFNPTGQNNQVQSLGKAKNLLADTSSFELTVSHVNGYAENIGYGTECLTDGVAKQTKPYYMGVDKAATLEFSFDGVYNVDRVRLYRNYAASSFPQNFTISAYTKDGWQTVKTVSNYASSVGWNNISFDDAVCSAIRLTTTDASKMDLGEIEILGSDTLANVETPGMVSYEAVALAVGQNEVALNNGTYVEEGYRLIANSANETAKLQFMFDYTVDARGISFFTKEAEAFPSAFQVYAYTGSAWELVHTVSGYTPSAGTRLHEFTFNSPVTCTSIMAVFDTLYDIYGAGNSYGLQIQEMRVDGVQSKENRALLGVVDTQGSRVESTDINAVREILIGTRTASASFDLNMDSECTAKDLVRIKRFFSASGNKTREFDITCMSFNLLAEDSEVYGTQVTRAPLIAQYIREQQPDLVGIQECAKATTYDWTTDFVNQVCANGLYTAVKIGDESGFKNTSTHYKADGTIPAGSGLVIFYKTSRFETRVTGAAEYSDISYTSDNQQRYYQWVMLTDRLTGEKVTMTNTHWSINRDEEGIANRSKQSDQLLAFWQKEVGNGLLFGTGDYNDNQRTQSIYNLQSTIYKEVIGLKGGSDHVINHIDHVFCNPQVMNLKESEFLHATVGGTVLSDHSQILTTISYKK